LNPGIHAATTTITTATTITTVTETSTTATPVCNGSVDPPACAERYVLDDCRGPEIGKAIQTNCPILCGTCEPLKCFGTDPDPAICRVKYGSTDCDDVILSAYVAARPQHRTLPPRAPFLFL